MLIIENTNLRATLQFTDSEGNTKPVVNVNTNLTKGGSNFNLNFTVIDETVITNNLEAIQLEIDSFKTALSEKMIEFGYKITL